jgi:hypothetical protein
MVLWVCFVVVVEIPFSYWVVGIVLHPVSPGSDIGSLDEEDK